MSEVVRRLVADYCEKLPVRSEPLLSAVGPKRVGSLRSLRNAKEPTLSIGEMYSGPGGIGLAAHRAKLRVDGRTFRFRHVFATDYDADTCQTFAQNLLRGDVEAQVICGDVRNLPIDDLPSVDGFLYGFPCNDFSIVGESKGLDGEFGPLYKYGVDYINRNDPLFLFAENVSGLSSANAGLAFGQIIRDLGSAGSHGYELTVNLYKFEEYGVPQARHRLIIVGMRKDLGIRFEVPKPSGIIKTCREAIETPPIGPNAPNNELTAQSAQVVERLSYIRPGENAWTADLPPHLRLNVTGAQLSQIYKRLDPDKPAYTITGSGGGGTHVYHWRENRALTNRERARLQTFPDDFIFFGSKESVRKQIGMAVPPDGAQVILEAILKTLAGKNYRSVEPTHGYA